MGDRDNVGGMLPNQPPAAWETLEQAIRIRTGETGAEAL